MIDLDAIGTNWHVKRIAQIYVVLNKPIEEKFRIDAVCILGDLIKHYENI
jgi:hypothetical protein